VNLFLFFKFANYINVTGSMHFCYRYAQHFEIFAGISVLAPCVEIPLACFFLSALLFSLFKTLGSFHIGLFQYCFNTIEYGQDQSLEQLMKPVVVQATNAAHVGHVALQQTQITGYMVIKTLEVSRF